LDSDMVFYVVKSIVNPNVEQDWDTWHTNSHVPDVLKQPGFLKATKFRRAEQTGDKPEYWTIYEMQSMKAFHEYSTSEAAKKLRADQDAKFGDAIKAERYLLVKLLEISREGANS
jgi:antibiotic biosynthesis monooxygenase (ABM) superfamily enzyme